MKSIKIQTILVILTLVILLCAVFGVTSCYLNYSTAASVLRLNMTETALVAADRVAAEIAAIQGVAIETGCLESLASGNVTLEEKKAIIDQRAKTHHFQRGNLLNLNGISVFDGNDYSERDYFQAAVKGEPYISDPTISKITGKITFLISAPLWAGGIPGTKVIGVIYYAPKESFLNDIVSEINVSESGHAYIINKDGTNVADKYPEKVGVENMIAAAQADASLKESAELETKMIAGEDGFGRYRREGELWAQGYAPIANTNRWSLGVMMREKDFLGSFYLSLVITAILVGVFLVLGMAVALVYANRLGKSIRDFVPHPRALSGSDPATPVPAATRKDGTGVLMDASKLPADGRTVKTDMEGFVPIRIATAEIEDLLNDETRGRSSSGQVTPNVEGISADGQSNPAGEALSGQARSPNSQVGRFVLHDGKASFEETGESENR